MLNHVFISHSPHDTQVVSVLRNALEDLHIPAWTERRELTPGDAIDSNTASAIESAQHFVVVLGPQAASSPCVRKEIRHALAVRETREDFKIIPILLDPIEPGILPLFFGDKPVALSYATRPGAVSEILPDLLAALGLTAPVDGEGAVELAAKPVADLILELQDPRLDTSGGKLRATATAKLVYEPPSSSGERRTESTSRFRFTAPLGPIETEEIRWYLEKYHRWPSGVFQERARRVEAKIEVWGKLLAEPLLAEICRDPFEAWKETSGDVERRFSVLVDDALIEGSGDEARARAAEGAMLLLSLPWELVHNDDKFLFQGARGVRVRRRLPNRRSVEPMVRSAPIRVLLVSPRPDAEPEMRIDHRVSAKPLVEALDRLGELAELKIVSPPTLKALDEVLRAAREAGRPFHVVHFDGHGVYDRKHGLGGLCFERPEDAEKLTRRRHVTVDAKEIAAVLKEHRVPLVFLEACQTAMAEEDPTASVAGRLLAGGVASVVAMSHSVLVETARRFVTVFYGELMAGRRVGEAMLAGQRELHGDSFRGKVWKGELHLQDWFVPVLFQEEADPRLVARLPAKEAEELASKRRTLALGALPETPEHDFVGRSRELLLAERLLERERYAVVLGEGGEGKTTLAAELARWLVATRRFRRAAFVSLEHHLNARTVLHALGDQLVPGFASKAGQSDEAPWQLVERALREQATIVVLDNLETVLPPPPGSPEAAAFEPETLEALLDLARRLVGVGSTRLVFTSREKLPEPFEGNRVQIGRLPKSEAIELVGKVLRRQGITPAGDDEGDNEEEVEALVEAVGAHARSLVLVAREVGASGVRQATEQLSEIMASLAAKHPDDRERSLFASVELSLRRLPEETREKVPGLAVLHGGTNLWTLSVLLELDTDHKEHEIVAHQLIDVGLAEMLPYAYLRLHPALGPSLDRDLSGEEREEARRVWLTAMEQLTTFLRQQRSQDAQLAATLTLLELPNLLAALEALHASADADRVVGMATKLEGLLEFLSRPRALARAVRIREEASGELPEWNHSRFLAEDAAVDRLLDAGRFAEAVKAARKIVGRGQAAGEVAYEGAAYDLATAHIKLGRALQWSGAAEESLTPLAEARKRFQKLTDEGNADAASMVSASLTEFATSLADVGRLDEAAQIYEASIKNDEARNAVRGVAVSKGQLGSVRLRQQRFKDALEAYIEAREIFERLEEPRMVAVAWHQIGMAHREAGQLEAAEEAYQRTLRITVQREGDRPSEASTLNQLGNLYDAMGRLEEAVRFHQQAASIYAEIGDSSKEGRTRTNLAISLIKLRRYDEARQEILRALECKKPYGPAAQSWKTFNILHDLERAVGNDAAATEARESALEAYLAYRQAGGENHSPAARHALAVGQALATGQKEEITAELAAHRRRSDLPAGAPQYLDALQAILAGSRDPALAADLALSYDLAAEIVLLLEGLEQAGG